MMKFSYKKLAHGYLRPIIPISISHNGKTVRCEALVDSGADMCAFDADIAEALDIRVENGRVGGFGGVMGGSRPIYYHPVTVSVGGWPYTIEAGFSRDIASYGHGFLGQHGFFDHFIVQFNFAKEEIELRDYRNRNQ